MLLLCKAHDKSCFILWQEEWYGIHHFRQQQDSKHTACCSIVVSIRYCRGVTQLLALPPMQHTLFVIVMYSKLSWGFNGSSLPIADSSNTELGWRFGISLITLTMPITENAQRLARCRLSYCGYKKGSLTNHSADAISQMNDGQAAALGSVSQEMDCVCVCTYVWVHVCYGC